MAKFHILEVEPFPESLSLWLLTFQVGVKEVTKKDDNGNYVVLQLTFANDDDAVMFKLLYGDLLLTADEVKSLSVRRDRGDLGAFVTKLHKVVIVDAKTKMYDSLR